MSTPSAPLPVAFRDWEKEVSSCGPGGEHNNESQSRKGWSVRNHLERGQDVEDATQTGRLFTPFLFTESTVWKP